MIGLDTTILVRYLTQDDPLQSPKATEIIERRLTEESPGFVSIVAMVETVLVLDRAYGLPPHKIAAAVERMLQTDVLEIENEQEVFTAMVALKQGQGSFAAQGGAAPRLRTPLTCVYARAPEGRRTLLRERLHSFRGAFQNARNG